MKRKNQQNFTTLLSVINNKHTFIKVPEEIKSKHEIFLQSRAKNYLIKNFKVCKKLKLQRSAMGILLSDGEVSVLSFL